MSIISLYRKDQQPFAQIPNSVIRDPNISPNAFRLLAYLMSHRDGYELNYEQIEVQTTLGRYAINAAAKQLIELGWLEVNRPTINGRFACKQWVILNPLANESTADDSTMEYSQVGQSADNIRTSIIKEEHLYKNTNSLDAQPMVSPKKGTRFSEDSVLTDEWIAYAVQHHVNAKLEFEKFKNFWISAPGAKGVKLNWTATWRNWILNVVERQSKSYPTVVDKKQAERDALRRMIDSEMN
jgi:hypothetical protein